MVNPNKSLVVVMNGPDAKAGLKPNRLRISGVMVPTKEENSTTPKSAAETVKDSRWLSNNNNVAANTMTDKKSPFNNATLKTLLSRLYKPSSTKLGFTKLCTTNDDDWMPTLPPVA